MKVYELPSLRCSVLLSMYRNFNNKRCVFWSTTTYEDLKITGSGIEMTRFLIDQTSREALTKERAEEVLKGLGEGTTSVKLSGKSFGDGSAEVVAAALKRAIPSLTGLDIADIIASRPEEEAKRTLATIADALASCKHLECIDLSDNALGAKGIRAVGDLLTGQKKLRELLLCNNGLAADAGTLICSALIATAPTPLVRLHFHNNLLETAGSVALAPVVESSPFLEDFRFSSLRLGREGAVRICQALEPRLSLSLKSLNLSDNSFGQEGAEAIAKALLNAPVLEMLIVNDTLLGDGGVRSICEALATGAPELRVLNVSGNEVGLEGSKGLAKLLSTGYLQELSAEDNELGTAGATAISRGIRRNSSLRVLTLNTSEIGGRGALAIAKASFKLPELHSVNMNGNSISTDLLLEIETLLGDKLGPLDENDEDGAEDNDQEHELNSASDRDEEEGRLANGLKPKTSCKRKNDVEKVVEILGNMKIKDSQQF